LAGRGLPPPLVVPPVAPLVLLVAPEVEPVVDPEVVELAVVEAPLDEELVTPPDEEVEDDEEDDAEVLAPLLLVDPEPVVELAPLVAAVAPVLVTLPPGQAGPPSTPHTVSPDT
jgi:hypothetical protein